MTKLYEPSLPRLMKAIATEANGMRGMDRRNFLKRRYRGSGRTFKRANDPESQRICKSSTKPP